MHLLNRRSPLLAALLIASWTTAAMGQPGEASDEKEAAPPPSKTYALLINGGSSPKANFLSHLHHLQDMHATLVARGIPEKQILVFNADGERPAADLAQTREGVPSGWWLLAGTEPGRILDATHEIVNTEWPGRSLKPASYGALRNWFRKSPLKPGDTLLIYVTDHGEDNPDDLDNGRIDLWHEEMSVAEYEALLAELPEGVKAVSVMSQCYSGSFAHAIYAPGEAEPPGDTCGYYSTVRDRQAYGCYPGGRGAERVGHAFHFIDGLTRNEALGEAHDEVLVYDDRPDVPVRSSELYLERLLEAEAEARGVPFEEVVDALLKRAWRDRARWAPHIRLIDAIGDAYGTFSPRTLAELSSHAGALPDNAKAVRTYWKRWRETLNDLKRANLMAFKKASKRWGKKLAPKALKDLDDAGRQKLLKGVIPALERFTRKRAEVWSRALTLRQKARVARGAWERLELRYAILLRLRARLVQVAGEVWLAEAGREAQRAAWARLRACEALTPGAKPDPEALALKSPTPPKPLPPFAEELATMESVLPSWLGIRFRPLKDNMREKRGLTGGAVAVMTVFPDSPAEAAGLKPGDLLLGPPGKPFEEPRQIREWTMRSPQKQPLPIEIIREGERLTLELTLGPYPLKWPELPSPPQVGEEAPAIEGLKVVTGPDAGEALSLKAGPYMLFYWATWCGPCKRAVPELMAWGERSGVRLVAVTDEDEGTVKGFMEKWDKPFVPLIVSDELRRSFVAHGVSGTPTFIWVGPDGVVRHRQVGYNIEKGLKIEGWGWSP